MTNGNKLSYHLTCTDPVIKGQIELDDNILFRIANIQSHYPSGGVPQSVGAVIELLKKGNPDNIPIARIKFSNLYERIRSNNLIEDVVPGPRFIDDVLHMYLPFSCLPLWQMVLTQLPTKSYYISYQIECQKSWAFLQPYGNGIAHKVGT